MPTDDHPTPPPPAPPPAPPQTAPPTPGILETVLYADDLEAMAAFYGGQIGLAEVTRQPGRHVFFRVAGGMLLIFRPSASEQPATSRQSVPVHGARGPGHMCFAAPDIEVWVRYLTERAIEIEAQITWPNGARSVYVRDPAGNSVEFAEPHLWPV